VVEPLPHRWIMMKHLPVLFNVSSSTKLPLTKADLAIYSLDLANVFPQTQSHSVTHTLVCTAPD
jgi:hypothetical protein